MTAALSGLRIVSTAVNVPGPVAAARLRAMGADVVKIEPPSGDPVAAGAAGWYEALCEGISVRRLDLKSAAGRAALHAVLESADVLITSSRPSSLGRLGLDWNRVRERWPRLCHVAIVGYPAPRSEEAGHDLTYQAEAGLLSPPAMPRALLADLAGAAEAVAAALELLLARERGLGAGYREVALSDAAAAFGAPLRHGLTEDGGWLGGGSAAYNVYRASDGWVAVAALEPEFRSRLSRELGVDVDDGAALAASLETRTAEAWHQWALDRGLPLAAVRV